MLGGLLAALFCLRIQQIFPEEKSNTPAFSTQAMLAIPKKQIANCDRGKEKRNMSSKNNNKLNVPEARAAMDKFKMEAAAEVGVDLKEGYNGHLTSREAGSVGGQMVKKMIESYEKSL
jgi:small acid-soluble spore protein D (minor alpha/beta-type SASP)